MTCKWDKRFLALAKEVASWSRDPSTRVGTVIVNPDTKTVLAIGFNGFPRLIRDDPDRLFKRSKRLRYTIHAEVNAILNAALLGVKVQGMTMYVYGLPPCEPCSLAIIQVGIKRVVVKVRKDKSLLKVPKRWQMSCARARENFMEAGVELSL